MARTANISPLGLFNWDNTIFDLMVIPEELNRETLINNLLAETAELEVLYPNPTVFKNLLGIWSAKELPVWDKLYDTTQFEYNPIENYNRYEEGVHGDTDTHTHTGTDTHTDTTTHTGQDTTSANGKDEHYISAFDTVASGNDDGLQKQTRDESEGSTTTTYGSTNTNNGGITYGKTITDTNQGSHAIHAHGNIGVTTTQKLIKEERAIDLFNLYDIIIESFKMRFCILVY